MEASCSDKEGGQMIEEEPNSSDRNFLNDASEQGEGFYLNPQLSEEKFQTKGSYKQSMSLKDFYNQSLATVSEKESLPSKSEIDG